MIGRSFIYNNIITISITIFIICYFIILQIKPSFLFNKDGSIREFGIGFKNKTVIPIWMISIVLGILCYFIVMYYVALPKLYL